MNHKILIIEDDSVIQKELKKLFRCAHCVCHQLQHRYG